MQLLGRRGVMAATIAAGVASAAGAQAEPNGWGLVPGARVGVVHATFDGSAAMPTSQQGWGRSTEVHLDALRTFASDRAALAVSVGVVTQARGTISEDLAAPGEADAFRHAGLSLSLMLTTMVVGRNSVTARVGLSQGKVETQAGPINADLTRYGLELHRLWAMGILHVAGEIGVEYFAGADDGRGYRALTMMAGATFSLGGRR